MKRIFLLLFLFNNLFLSAQVSWQGGATPDQTAPATILFDRTGTPLASQTGVFYAHTGVTLNGNAWSNVIGSWGDNTQQPSFTLVSGNIYKLDLTPTIMAYYGITSGSITKINLVIRNAAGTAQTADLTLNVGAFQANLVSPVENSISVINSGQNVQVTANNTNGSANYNLFANGVSINTSTGSSFSFTDSNVTINKSYELQITQGITSFTKKFSVIVNGGTITQAMPSGLEDGINYNPSDASKATLVLTAPGKDFVYVAGSFNDWVPGSSYLMKKDPTSNKFWLELNGLTSGNIYTYQYWVVDATPAANSPAVVKTADPFSTLVLSPFDDSYIPSSSYPNLPQYPSGQEREVTVLQTGQTAYPWSLATTNFVKPNKDNLVIYEVLVRDFDANRNYQDLINKIDYFKDLGINAIQLMPIMEFEGNESWGYNTSFHMALDKFYGTKEKLKEFVDVCHQNGIAVILDIAFNHAFGRNPMVRMWMNDPDGDGWGGPSSENPYLNTTARHSYSVGEDFNHTSALTKYHVKRTIKHWIEEFKIDGFRWDLTKGFTQNCSGGDDGCTNQYQQDRVDVLKEYADYSWSLDGNHYVVFEHLGSDNEEQQWANYRLNEGKGIMMWGEMFAQYKELALGYATQNINRMTHTSRGFAGKRLIGYPESHDKDRLMYEAITYGNGGGTAPVNGNLTNALARMGAIGATSILVPGPKMIWHFAELGSNQSIYTCGNGTINDEGSFYPGDCKLDTKPQVQWSENWLADPRRVAIHNDWSRMIKLKTSEPVFNGECTISTNGSNIRQRIYVYDNSLPSTQLKNVVILANFSVANQNITPDFPYTGMWYNLMDNTPYNVTSTSAQITLPPGQFRIFGNQPATLGTSENQITSVKLYPNPANNFFVIEGEISKAEIYSVTGQMVKSFEAINSSDYQFDINDLTKGVYLVKVFDVQNRTKTMKLIKQ
jgi:1,4-alpha-glucan branching enzyme